MRNDIVAAAAAYRFILFLLINFIVFIYFRARSTLAAPLHGRNRRTIARAQSNRAADFSPPLRNSEARRRST